MRRILSVLVFLFFTGIVCGDEVRLLDGSVLRGKIIEIWGGKLKISTDFAGDLSIDRGKVTSFSTVESVMVTRDSVAPAEQRTASNLSIEAVDSLWRVGVVDPRLPKPRKWSYEANVDVTGKTGNSEKHDLGGGFKATLAGPEDTLKLFMHGDYGRENGAKNEEEFVLGVDFERMIGGTDNSWYVRTQVEHDEMDNYDRYYTSAFGYGYYLVRTPAVLMRLRLGMNYMRKEYVNDQDTDDGLGVDVNYHHEIDLKSFLWGVNMGKLVTDVTYTPAFEEWSEDYRIYHESALDIPLGSSGAWKIRLGVSNEYNNKVTGDTERIDTSYFGRLVFQWK